MGSSVSVALKHSNLSFPGPGGQFVDGATSRQPARDFWGNLRPVVLAFVFGTWLVLNVISVSPWLHHLLHGDYDQATHQCFITQFASGQLLADLPTAVTHPAPPATDGTFPLWETRVVSVSLHLLPGSRGPPAQLFVATAG